jgi:phenylacetate-coenzyme A ligase PaaK-like adenylate-forming protein
MRQLQPWWGGRLQSHSFLQPMPALVDALNRQQPTVLATYPSTALQLAQQACAGQLRLALREVWTGGENLSPAMRRAIGQAFDCPVSQSYGASEFLSLAAECRCGRLHLNSDWAVLESVDEHHRPVPAGTTGCTTLLTNLANPVQPLIRYDLGDRIAPHEPGCACGSPWPVVEVAGPLRRPAGSGRRAGPHGAAVAAGPDHRDRGRGAGLRLPARGARPAHAQPAGGCQR